MTTADTILITGGAGFIGSNFVSHCLTSGGGRIVNLDRLTYAGNLKNLADVRTDPRHVFVKGDIGNSELVRGLLASHRPAAVINFAAESHVDRSIHSPGGFIRTNIVGVFRLLEEIRSYYEKLNAGEQRRFRFLQVSTDEVYGSLSETEPPPDEDAAFRPNSPYAASKASADLLVRAYHRTYGLPVITTNCSNNYGPYQFPEKLIPLVIINAINGRELPIYGDGGNVRDWIYVEDHCLALHAVLKHGRPGETYNVGGTSAQTNLDTVRLICDALDELSSQPEGSYRRLITFVPDRPGHDRRYVLDTTKTEREIGWRARETFHEGIRKTIRWYLENRSWVDQITKRLRYRSWLATNYERRAAR
jgi:dTDP-glucose 4,6-dehydratase